MIYRNPKLLKAAKDVPYCMYCMKTNDGTIVACHSNSGSDGKGMGIKAKDYRIAYMCNECHDNYDRGKLIRIEKQAIFEAAHRATIGWLFESGIVGVL